MNDRPPAEAPTSDAPGPRGGRRRRPPAPTNVLPDILYHATTQDRAQRAVQRGVLDVGGGRAVYLSRTESQAWQVAHRLAGDPCVLYIDAGRGAATRRLRFERNRQGLWQVPSVPVGFVLNLREGFAEQASAGGVPVWFGPDGPEVLLIQVQRGNRLTWEVAKGKLEAGESPEQAAVREVGEEIGIEDELTVLQSLGVVRYGFTTPEQQARLKTLHMYLLRATRRHDRFRPAVSEGIRAAAWFSPDEAMEVVVHRSLIPLMRRVALLLEQVGPSVVSERAQSTGT